MTDSPLFLLGMVLLGFFYIGCFIAIIEQSFREARINAPIRKKIRENRKKYGPYISNS